MLHGTRVAIKVDVDTFRGSREGVPGLLAELRRAGVRASFFLTMGPDRSGMAILRVFRKRGFLRKMLRTNPARMYGLRTMLYGTLLPAPRIARRAGEVLRRVREEGHEAGLHAWDHVLWQDRLRRLTPGEVREQLRRGIEAFRDLFGEAPRGFAAPGWITTDPALESLEEAGFEYLSASRGREAPFRPLVGGGEGTGAGAGRVLDLIEIPTTLPTLDEAIGRDGLERAGWNDHLLGLYRPGATEVLTVHAETEGLAYRGEFGELLRRHAGEGIVHPTLGELAREARSEEGGGGGGRLEKRRLVPGTVPGRSGRVSVPGARRPRRSGSG